MSELLTILKNAKPAEQVLAGLKPADANQDASLRAGQNLVKSAKEAKLALPDYLRLAVNPNEGTYAGSGMDGFECALAFLDLPVKEDIGKGVLLQAAAETFNTFPGTRALFPPVVDSVLQWKYRQDNIESTLPIVGQSRVVSGVEVITTVVDDKPEDYQATGVIAEGAEIPVRSLRTSEKNVKFYKFGGGIELTYEFERRQSIDIITPYALRVERENQIGQTAMATAMLINGDGLNPAAPEVDASDLAGGMSPPVTGVAAGEINWEILLKWLVSRAQAGMPIDTIVGNWDMYLSWLRMFATPTQGNGPSQIETLAKAGVSAAIANPRLPMNINFALSSTAPERKLIGFIRGETLEELIENGSDIEESTRAVTNQRVRYVKTINKGYRLVFGDTRSVLNLDAVA